ncbi:MFS transporter [Vibrio cholerae]|uniref:MFS transporter n=1 Tax=Vibrio cholerae TaxID=666 RepID=UPI0006E52670|nr:MFS transporter [Vibrio cholerae]KQA38547.1 MFS transporter permease [Vibrio cholerae]KQA42758.1 MFS transporter permease [Vibrio cholerae]KQA57648.1 MFS transporter permease [Vibrio cholerae]KQA73139.1 MFS transporter permease [Vibrio cholerae]KQA78178.1 MFS transporter permease [Vibrio cholerae]
MIELHSPQYLKVTFALAFGSFLVFCNLYLFQPMLPYLANHFAVSETQINWLFAASTLALSLCLVPWAVTSEAVGRRLVMLTGLFAMPVIGLAMLYAEQFWFLVLTRALMGVALAAFASVAVAYMVEELSPQAFGKAIGGYIAANSLGGITGRIAGGLLTDALGWQHAVVAMAIFTLLGALWVAYLLPIQQHFKPQRGLFFHHNRALVKHLQNRTLWLAMLIGGVNFALFVNLYSVMGFRLVAEPYSLPIGIASLIFVCYLAGTLSSKLTANWNRRFSAIPGMMLGALISMAGMLIALIEAIPAMLAGLILISFGAFFTHTLAYAWVSQKATQAKATATALYLVHYYIGGSLGGFYLLYCWQHGGWEMVTLGGLGLYFILFILGWRLSRQNKQTPQGSQALASPSA